MTTAMAPERPAPPTAAPPPPLPLATRARILLRCLVVQGAWSYDGMIGPGIAYAIEPALRLLPGGVGGDAYRSAMARHGQFFNCHPYFSSLAVGALARLELQQVNPATITRFRSALCGPLGSVGDRLVWAAFLPACALLGMLVWGLGATPAAAVAIFLVSYNLGHLGLRAWGLHEGWQRGQQVAAALSRPAMRDGPAHIARGAAWLAGLAVPLVAGRLLPGDPLLVGMVLVAALPGGYVVARLHGRVQGWLVALALLLLLTLLGLLT